MRRTFQSLEDIDLKHVFPMHPVKPNRSDSAFDKNMPCVHVSVVNVLNDRTGKG